MKATLEDLKREQWLRKRNSLTWTDRFGNSIPISQMSDEYLENAINVLQNNFTKTVEIQASIFNFY